MTNIYKLKQKFILLPYILKIFYCKNYIIITGTINAPLKQPKCCTPCQTHDGWPRVEQCEFICLFYSSKVKGLGRGRAAMSGKGQVDTQFNLSGWVFVSLSLPGN